MSVWPAGGGAPIRVSDTGSAGPIELWTVRAAIEAVAQRISWDETTAAPAAVQSPSERNDPERK